MDTRGSIRFQTDEEKTNQPHRFIGSICRESNKKSSVTTVPRAGTRRRICGSARVYSKFGDRAAGGMHGELRQNVSYDRAWESSLPRRFMGAEYPRSESDGELHYSDVNPRWWSDYAYANTYYSF